MAKQIMSKSYTTRGSIQWMDLDESERDELCPLFSVAMQAEVRCKGIRCAMWIPHVTTEVDGDKMTIYGAGLGHCGFIHPGHEGILMNEETDDGDA